MSYPQDVFIGYRREFLWTTWIRDHFQTLLASYLQPDLGRKPDIFMDERIDWDLEAPGQDRYFLPPGEREKKYFGATEASVPGGLLSLPVANVLPNLAILLEERIARAKAAELMHSRFEAVQKRDLPVKRDNARPRIPVPTTR